MANYRFWLDVVRNIQEDEALAAVMAQDHRFRWNQVAAIIRGNLGDFSKNGKQCRERWLNHLNPVVSKRHWTAGEEHRLFFTSTFSGTSGL